MSCKKCPVHYVISLQYTASVNYFFMQNTPTLAIMHFSVNFYPFHFLHKYIKYNYITGVISSLVCFSFKELFNEKNWILKHLSRLVFSMVCPKSNYLRLLKFTVSNEMLLFLIYCMDKISKWKNFYKSFGKKSVSAIAFTTKNLNKDKIYCCLKTLHKNFWVLSKMKDKILAKKIPFHICS